MEASYFVLLLLDIVAILVILLMAYYAKKGNFVERRLKQLVQGYMGKWIEQKGGTNRELERLRLLFQKGEIDDITYERLKQVLKNDYEKKRQEADGQLYPVSSNDGH